MIKKNLLTLAAFGIFTATCLVLGYLFGWFGILIAAALFIIACGIQLYKTYKLLSIINHAPEGYTGDAAQLRQRIHTGMPLIKIVQAAQALGKKKNAQNANIYTWQDHRHQLKVTFQDQKTIDIELTELGQATLSRPSD